jgi:serine/threonine protein kinase
MLYQPHQVCLFDHRVKRNRTIPLRFTRFLGEGGSGFVFEVENKELGHVAVKCAKPEEAVYAQREQSVLLRLRNSVGIPNLIASGRILGFPSIVLPLLQKIDLLPIEPSSLTMWTRVLVDAMKTLHRRGYIHRDIKPQNIMLDPRSRKPVLLDFAFAYAVNSHFDGYHGTAKYSSERSLWGLQPSLEDDFQSLCFTLYRFESGKQWNNEHDRPSFKDLERISPIVQLARSLFDPSRCSECLKVLRKKFKCSSCLRQGKTTFIHKACSTSKRSIRCRKCSLD